MLRLLYNMVFGGFAMKLIIVKKSNSGYTVEFDQELTDSPEDDQDAFVADAIAALEDKLMSLRYDSLS